MTPHQLDASRLIPGSCPTAEAAERRLHASPYLALKAIHCEYRDGVLTLTGQLPSYYLKQMAQALFTNVEGIHRIDNRIEVVVPASLPRTHQGDAQASEGSPHLDSLPRSFSPRG